MKLPDNVYLALKWIMLLATPVCTFVIGIYEAIQTGSFAAIVTAIIGGLGTLAGVIIKISDSAYKQQLEGGK